MLLENGYILSFPENLALTDAEFFDLCQANPDLNLERDKNKRILIMAPTGVLSDYQSNRIATKLSVWNEQSHLGRVFGSSAGFTLPDGSVKSPDCAWVSMEKWSELTLEQKEKFAPVCPEFVVEVKSPSDSMNELKAKMTEWMANGVKLAWLVDVKEEIVMVYSSHKPVETISSFDQKLPGKNTLPGFEFDLQLLKEV